MTLKRGLGLSSFGPWAQQNTVIIQRSQIIPIPLITKNLKLIFALTPELLRSLQVFILPSIHSIQ